MLNYSIPRINLSTAAAIREGANLAWLAIEMEEITNAGHVAMTIKEHLRQGKPVMPIVQMVKDQWRSGAKRELTRLFGSELLRKILNCKI